MVVKHSLSFVFLVLTLFCTQVLAIDTWHESKEANLSWEHVIESINPEVYGVVTYEIIIAPEDKSSQIVVSTVSDNSYHIILEEYGEYIIGVKTLLHEHDGYINSSEIAWSDDPRCVFDGITFGMIYTNDENPIQINPPVHLYIKASNN